MAKRKKDDSVVAHVSGQANKPLSRPAHALTVAQAASELGAASIDGLSSQEATRRLDEYGRNEFGSDEGVQPLSILIGQIANAMTLVMSPTSGPASAGSRRSSISVQFQTF
jgi:magnesium-transporting ATPase (P-type)